MTDAQLALPLLKEAPLTPLDVLRQGGGDEGESVSLVRRAAGVFYTPRSISDHLSTAVLAQLVPQGRVRVCDPFAGDGRLVRWLIEHAAVARVDIEWEVALWDIHDEGLAAAVDAIEELRGNGHRIVDLECWTGDSFARVAEGSDAPFDCVVTNPPWENLKPDTRDLEMMPEHKRDAYKKALRATAAHLESLYPQAAATVKYGGWGTNLSRLGAEAAVRLLAEEGVLGIVLPVSVLADQASDNLRGWLLTQHSVVDIGYVPAEARPFASADVGACTLTILRKASENIKPHVTMYDRSMDVVEAGPVELGRSDLADDGNLIPVGFGLEPVRLGRLMSHLPRFGDLETNACLDAAAPLWAGRELDETRIGQHLNDTSGPLFVKGRMVQRFEIVELPEARVLKPGWEPPASVNFERVVWRDISRRSQCRRVIATLVPPGWAAGNSLGVAYFKDGDSERLRLLLGLMSSLAFEVQLRSKLATGHVTLASLRKVHIPEPSMEARWAPRMLAAVSGRLRGNEDDEVWVEALAAKAFGLDACQTEKLVDCFPRLASEYRREIVSRRRELAD